MEDWAGEGATRDGNTAGGGIVEVDVMEVVGVRIRGGVVLIDGTGVGDTTRAEEYEPWEATGLEMSESVVFETILGWS